METAYLPIVFGLASAASWGAGDFCGGFATKRTPVFSVIAISQMVGGLLMVVLALATAEPIASITDLLIGGLAGVCGAFGLLALYSGLATRPMGVVAPVTAVVSTALPVVIGTLGEGLPPERQLLGFGVALVAVWLIARGHGNAQFRLRDLDLPLAAGAGFGLFFVLIDRLSGDTLFWPLAAARSASVGVIILLALARGQRIVRPTSQPLTLALAGIFDTGGNVFFALATQLGRLDISAVLASLYPAGTVLLAWIVLKEKLARGQQFGVLAALAALVLIGG